MYEHTGTPLRSEVGTFVTTAVDGESVRLPSGGLVGAVVVVVIAGEGLVQGNL